MSENEPPDPKEPRFDNVKIVGPEGEVIEGHEAVEAFFAKEQSMLDEHGSSIIFQIHRVDLDAPTVEQLQGDRLAEIKVDGGFVSGEDQVADVEHKVRVLIEKEARSPWRWWRRLWSRGDASPALSLRDADQMTLFFCGERMQPEALFYADHAMMLPAWVQVLLHDCPYEDVLSVADMLKDTSRTRG